MSPERIAQGLLQSEALGVTLGGEARNQGERGMRAVGAVCFNRLAWGRWGDTYVSVVTARKQFSCWNPGEDANHLWLVRMATLLKTGIRPKDLLPALAVADAIVTGMFEDETHGADHYCTSETLTTRRPQWADPGKMTVAIGDHVFFKLRGE